MVPASTKPGSTLALLAICLHLAVAVMGGRLCCYQTDSTLQGDSCADHCCEQIQPGDAHAMASETPACPGDSDCCVEQGREVFFPSNVQVQIKDLDLVAPALVAVITHDTKQDNISHEIAALIERIAHPPPALAVVRTTVLLI